MELTRPRSIRRRPQAMGRNLTPMVSQKSIQGSGCAHSEPGFLSRCAAHPSSFSYLPNFRPGAVVIRSSSQHTISSCSSKLHSPSSPSGLSPSTRRPFGSLVPPLLSQSVSPRLFSITPYHDLTWSPSTARELEAWMFKRDLAPNELFSRGGCFDSWGSLTLCSGSNKKSGR